MMFLNQNEQFALKQYLYTLKKNKLFKSAQNFTIHKLPIGFNTAMHTILQMYKRHKQLSSMLLSQSSLNLFDDLSHLNLHVVQVELSIFQSG